MTTKLKFTFYSASYIFTLLCLFVFIPAQAIAEQADPLLLFFSGNVQAETEACG